MKLLQFAIESIVDANSSQGLISGSGKIDYVAAEQHGRAIRSDAIVKLIETVKSLFAKTVASYR